MSGFDRLLAFSGKWRGTNLLWLSPGTPSQESATILILAPAINGKFIEVKYTWAYEDQPQEGVLLIGFETESKLATAVWADSWHMGEKFMRCQGVVTENGGVDVRGQYPAPPGPDWGWRIRVEPTGKDTLNLLMYNITPEGEETLAVKAVCQKVT